MRLLRNSLFMRLRYLALSLLFLSSVSQGIAQTQLGGSSTYNFLELPVSARSAALGGNFITTRDGDLSLALENPSILDSSVNNKVVMSYMPYFAGINYGFFSYAHSIKAMGYDKAAGTFAVSVKYIDYGTFTQADDNGNITGTFWAGEYMANVGYGQAIKDSTFNAGVNAKVIYSHLQQYTSTGAALDMAGSYVSKNRRLFISVVVENMGSQITDYVPGNNEPLPFDVKVGIADKLAHAPFRFGVTLDHLEHWDITYIDPADTETVNPLTGQAVKTSSLGTFADKLMRHVTPNLELVLGPNFMIRVAYNYEVRKELESSVKQGLVGFSTGVGIRIYKFQLNYGLGWYYTTGPTSTLTLGLSLDQFYTRR